MEIGNQQRRTHVVVRQALGKSTGEPIEDANNNNNDNILFEKKINQDQRNKIVNIFNKSFFGKSSTKVSTISRQQQVSENLSDQSSGASSGDEWHLLEPDDDEEDGRFGKQNLESSDQVSMKLCLERKEANKMPSNNNSINNNRHEGAADKRTYVDLDPLADTRHKMSPGLVRLCTSLYALVPLASLCAFIALIFLLTTRLWPITVIYFTYLIFDRQTCNRGGRRWDAFYNMKFWSYLAAYFPIRLRFSNEFKLDPKENYILNYHPHGIAAFGCVATFATNGLNFLQLFPGIRSRFMVHEKTFCVPIMREIFALRGDCSVNSKSIDFILEKKYRHPEAKEATGNLLALVGGGLAEADLSNPEILKLVVASRKGFVKKALIHGANLIPCIAFGENSLYTKIDFAPNSLLYKLESHWYRAMKFKHPIYYGSSIFGGEKLKGAMPYKRPVTVCMGDPIKVERIAEPTQQQLDELHARYLQQLEQLYKANSDLCTRFDQRLELV